MKNSLPIAGDVTGAVAGFVATVLILGLVDFRNRADCSFDAVSVPQYPIDEDPYR
ncbi:hypothetical protein V1279_001529 [Bradyrhizobium sp. AZCC 1610]|uniref:hypothetical protein n=1 Tax=Bradyrhizobium sp. AZCC 1610 TaxID=3117020 RepID=UPI002FF25FBE